MKTYTVGFIFNETLSRVVLAHKNRPEWQKGKMNGVGGGIEPGEESLACIVREVHEETGLQTTPDAWTFIGAVHALNAVVNFYCMVHRGAADTIQTTTDERIEWRDTAHLPDNVLSNVPWLISFAIDRMRHDRGQTFDVHYD